jgi:hypothetical protein
VENIVAGAVIIDEDGNPFWSRLLHTRDVAKLIKEEMEQAHGVLVEANRFKRELRYFGPPSKLSEVQTDLVDLIKSASKERFVYHLDRHEFLWLRREGTETLTNAFGHETVSFHPKAKPHALTVTGLKEEYQEVRNIISVHCGTAQTILPAGQDSPTSCTICSCEAEQPVTLPCGHRYCSSCFADLCTSTTAPIRCLPGAEACETIIALPMLEASLCSTAFERMLRNAFDAYVAQHRDIHRPCPTPGCDNLYAPSMDTAAQETCTQCLLQTCTLCHEQHPDKSCPLAAGLQTEDEKAIQAWKDGENVKDCGQCKAPIEKADGCNHMECPYCHGHMCWVCSEMFETGRECYAHMAGVHGGYGLEDDVPQELIAEDAEARAALVRRHAEEFDAENAAAGEALAHRHAEAFDVVELERLLFG